jgi:hypothetical protein
LHLFREFNDGRADDSNSDADFTNAILQLRSGILTKPKFADGVAIVQTFITPVGGEFTQFGADTFTDVVGHSKDLSLKINFYDEA